MDNNLTDTELRDTLAKLYEKQRAWERKADETTDFAEKVYCLKQASKTAKERLRVEIELLSQAEQREE